MKRISLPRRAVSCALAASLALTLNPISAFAAQVYISDNGETENLIMALSDNGNTANTPSMLFNETPGPNINVTAPLKLYFGGENGTLDLADVGQTGKSIKADAEITNNGDGYNVVLESIKVHNEGLDSIFKMKTDADDANSILTQSIFSVKGKEGASAASTAFAAAREALEGEEPGLKDFECTTPKNSTGMWVASKSTETCEFSMDLSGIKGVAGMKADNGITSRRLISVVCTFDATALGIPSYELDNSGRTNSNLSTLIENAKMQDFYLQVLDPTHVDYLRVYSLSEVKGHADAMSEATDNNNNYYKSYFNFARYGLSKYDCKIKIKKTDDATANYEPLIVIGVMQDELAASEKTATSTYAGLTFHFKNILLNDNLNGNDGHAYYGFGNTRLYSEFNSSTKEPYKSIYDVLDNGVSRVRTVNKKGAPQNRTNDDRRKSWDCKMFLVGMREVSSDYRTDSDSCDGVALFMNGSSQVGDGRYIYYYYNSDSSYCAKGAIWWLRDFARPSNQPACGYYMPTSGKLADSNSPYCSVGYSLGVIPAFCL